MLGSLKSRLGDFQAAFGLGFIMQAAFGGCGVFRLLRRGRDVRQPETFPALLRLAGKPCAGKSKRLIQVNGRIVGSQNSLAHNACAQLGLRVAGDVGKRSFQIGTAAGVGIFQHDKRAAAAFCNHGAFAIAPVEAAADCACVVGVAEFACQCG